MFVAVLLLLLCSLGCSNAADSDYKQLTVKVALEILRVVNVDVHKEEADFDCVLTLSWNPWVLKDVGNPMSTLWLMWRPDVISYKSNFAEFSNSNATFVNFDVTWTQNLRTRVPCEIQWPSKDAFCQISFTSQSHDMRSLRLEATDIYLRYPDDATSLAESGYRIRGAGLIESARKDPCCEKRLHVIAFPINLTKHRGGVIGK